MSIPFIQNPTLEVTVVECVKLKDTEWFFSRQDPYVYLEYGNTKLGTRTCTDGGKNPKFQDQRFTFMLILGLAEITAMVYNNNTKHRQLHWKWKNTTSGSSFSGLR